MGGFSGREAVVKIPNNELHRINFRCHILCMEPHKIRHRKFTR